MSNYFITQLQRLPLSMGYQFSKEQQAVRAVFCNDFLLTKEKKPCIFMPLGEIAYITHMHNHLNLGDVLPKLITKSQVRTTIQGLNRTYHTSFIRTLNEVFMCTNRAIHTYAKKHMAQDQIMMVIPHHVMPSSIRTLNKRVFDACIREFLDCNIIGQINLLLKSSISSYEIAQRSSVHKTTIIGLRHHRRHTYNLTVSTAHRLDNFYQSRMPRTPLSILLYGNHRFYFNKNLIKNNDRLSFNKNNF